MSEQVAGVPPVETGQNPVINPGDGGTTPPVTQPVVDDTAAALAAANDRIAQIEIERDNYKRGMLQAKGKYEPTDPAELFPQDEVGALDALIDRKVEEKLYDKRLEVEKKEREALIAKTLRENEELKRALQNRPGGSPTNSGSNQDQPEVKTSHFSPEQEADLRSKGLDPAEVLKNMPKGGQIGSPSGA